MSFIITSESEYVIVDVPPTEGSGEPQVMSVDPTQRPNVTISGGNARLLNA